jgi:response regulator RpfG family c-di-GMP phosphodiesterase
MQPPWQRYAQDCHRRWVFIFYYPVPERASTEEEASPMLSAFLQRQKISHGLPILMISAKGEEAQAQAYAAGISDYLGKPFTLAQLRQRVRHLLGEEG